MTRSQLIQVLGSQFPDLSYKEIEKIVKTIFLQLSLALEHGKRIEIRGFGTFSLRFRNPRLARNPKTGQRVQKPGKFSPYFRPGKELRERVNSLEVNAPGGAV